MTKRKGTSLNPYRKNNVSEIKEMWSFRCYLEKINMKMLSSLVTLAAHRIFKLNLYTFTPSNSKHNSTKDMSQILKNVKTKLSS